MSSKRGRTSTAAVLTAPTPSQVDRIERPVCPHDLLDEEAEVWSSIVDSLPADWFKAENLPLLSQYSRHVIAARRIAELIERATADPKLGIRDYDRLLKAQARESAAISSLAVKMRISQSTVRNDRGNSKSRSAPCKPWEG
jgi:hypothetical protein